MSCHILAPKILGRDVVTKDRGRFFTPDGRTAERRRHDPLMGTDSTAADGLVVSSLIIVHLL